MELEVPSAAVHAESDASLSMTDTPSDSEELDLSGLVVILSFFFNIIFLIKKEN